MPTQNLKIIFLNYGPYFGCSGVHIHFLANALVDLGHECMVFLPNATGAMKYFGQANYQIDSFKNMLTLPVESFDNGIIHLWTTREGARFPMQLLRERVALPYLVHLEDNEVLITGKSIGIENFEEQKKFARENPQAFEKFFNTHPLLFERVMLNSSGVTCIIKKLEEFVPLGVPKMTFWPACEEEFFNIPLERNMTLRNAFEIENDTFVIVYPGAVHNHNFMYFRELLLAIEALNNEGNSIKLIRTGIEYDNYDDDTLALYKKHVLYVEDLDSKDLPRLMVLADLLVQPGSPGSFDDYRFPSKAPFFLASGKPVILPNTNVAEKLKHGQDCFLTKTGEAQEIMKYIKMLITHPDLMQNMGMQGRATARRLFSWKKAAESLIPFYKQALLRKN